MTITTDVSRSDTVTTVPDRRLRVVPDPRGSDLTLPVGTRFLLRLPVALGLPTAVVLHTTAAVVALPSRVVGLVNSAEQTLADVAAAVARTDALLDRVEDVTARADDVVQAASRAATVATGTVEQASTLIGPDLNQLLDSVAQLNRMVSRLPKVFRPRSDPRVVRGAR